MYMIFENLESLEFDRLMVPESEINKEIEVEAVPTIEEDEDEDEEDDSYSIVINDK